MKRIFVDSNFVIDHLRGRKYTDRLIGEIQDKQVQAYLSVVTVFELHTGALLSENPDKRIEDQDQQNVGTRVLFRASQYVRRDCEPHQHEEHLGK